MFLDSMHFMSGLRLTQEYVDFLLPPPWPTKLRLALQKCAPPGQSQIKFPKIYFSFAPFISRFIAICLLLIKKKC